MPSQSERARDIRVSLRVNGIDQAPMALDSGTFTYGITLDEFYTVGKATADLEEVAGPCALQLECRNKAWMQRLFYMARQRALGNPAYQDLRVSASFAMDHKGQGLSRFRMPDCKVSDPSTNFSGNEKVTSSLTLTDSDYVPA